MVSGRVILVAVADCYLCIATITIRIRDSTLDSRFLIPRLYSSYHRIRDRKIKTGSGLAKCRDGTGWHRSGRRHRTAPCPAVVNCRIRLL